MKFSLKILHKSETPCNIPWNNKATLSACKDFKYGVDAVAIYRNKEIIIIDLK